VKASDLTTSASGTVAPSDGTSGPAYVAVIDVVGAFLPKANGALQLGVNNMPAIVTAANGAPGISVPDIAAPKSEKVQVIRAGNGKALTADDTAVVQFTAINWAAKPTVQGSTWTDGDAATTVDLTSKTLPPSLKSALVGKKIGSQVMVVVPPSASGGASSTYIYVFDLLGAL
jgi:peptidylprolyl isomerase